MTKVITAYEGGESTGSIAKRLGRSRNAIGGLLKRNNLHSRLVDLARLELAANIF